MTEQEEYEALDEIIHLLIVDIHNSRKDCVDILGMKLFNRYNNLWKILNSKFNRKNRF